MGLKFKPHKGLRKRVKITRNGHVKRSRAGQRHRKSLHSSAQNRQLRLRKVAPEVERRRCQAMLGFKIRRPDASANEGGGEGQST